MDSEDLSALCSSLALEEDEETIAPDLEEGLQAQGKRSIDRSLVGCVLSTGPIGRDAFVQMIKGVWKTKERFDVEAIGSNKFVFHFLSITDRRRVFLGGPWCYQNKLLVLEEPAGVGDYSKMSFSQVPFWVQLHNIPVFCMSKAVGSILGNMVGRVQEVECNQDELCLGTFIRVRVIIDISKPLKRILKVRLGTDKELVTILLRYEHLPELCFLCGLFGHPLKECPERGTPQGDNLKLKYGAWIKAPIPSPGEPSHQFKRRRPSLGNSSHDQPIDNSVPRQPHGAEYKSHYSRPLPRHAEQPTHLHHPTFRHPTPSPKIYRPRGIGKAPKSSGHTTGKQPEAATQSAGSVPTNHHPVAPGPSPLSASHSKASLPPTSVAYAHHQPPSKPANAIPASAVEHHPPKLNLQQSTAVPVSAAIPGSRGCRPPLHYTPGPIPCSPAKQVGSPLQLVTDSTSPGHKEAPRTGNSHAVELVTSGPSSALVTSPTAGHSGPPLSPQASTGGDPTPGKTGESSSGMVWSPAEVQQSQAMDGLFQHSHVKEHPFQMKQAGSIITNHVNQLGHMGSGTQSSSSLVDVPLSFILPKSSPFSIENPFYSLPTDKTASDHQSNPTHFSHPLLLSSPKNSQPSQEGAGQKES